MTQRAVALMVGEQNDIAIAQERQNSIRAFAELHDLDVVSFLVVERKSMREGFQHAFTICASHHAGVIIIDSFKNMFMPMRDLMQTLGSLLKYNIALYAVYDNAIIDFDRVLAFHEILKACMTCDHEARSQHIKKSLKAIQKKGKKLGGIAFGAKASEGVIIKQIIKLYKDGFSLQKICNLLASNNIKTVTGKTWHPTTVKRIIDRNR